MSGPNTVIVKAIGRVLVVLAVTLVTGNIFFHESIFVLTRSPSQFLTSGITAALFYGTAKSWSVRSSLAAVFIWHIAGSLYDIHNRWLPILFFVYVSSISTVVHLYLRLIEKPVLDGIVQRIASISLLTGIMNALAVLVLSSISAVFGNAHWQYVPRTALENFQLGTLIGLGIGVGIEVAEYLLCLKPIREFIERTNAS